MLDRDGNIVKRATSYGFDVIDFATNVLHRPPRPWQRFAFIHGGELLPNGWPRARVVLLLAARQNGKTEVPVDLSLFWQFVEDQPLILGTSTKLDYAKESWHKATQLAEAAARMHDDVAAKIPKPRWKRDANGEQESWTTTRSRYKIAASNEEGGRSLTVHRGILDELRQHHNYSAWGAIEPAASPLDAQLWAMSNAGDVRSVVLNDLRDGALDFIATGEGDPRLLLLEWSSEEDADPTDPASLCQANPSVGYGLDLDVLLNAGRTAKRLGGEALRTFQTERMCIRVKKLKPALDPGAWARCLAPGDLLAVRTRVALAVDVSPDQRHCTAYAAAVLDDDRVRVDFVAAWEGPKCTDQMRKDLPGLIKRIRPRAFGWLPAGPAAAIGAELSSGKKRPGWPPPGCVVDEIRGDTAAVCMGFEAAVTAGRIAHSGDPLLDAHVGSAERLKRGDTWVFGRQLAEAAEGAQGGEGHVDALYAAAAAAHLARQLPKRRALRVITSAG